MFLVYKRNLYAGSLNSKKMGVCAQMGVSVYFVRRILTGTAEAPVARMAEEVRSRDVTEGEKPSSLSIAAPEGSTWRTR